MASVLQKMWCDPEDTEVDSNAGVFGWSYQYPARNKINTSIGEMVLFEAYLGL